MRPPPDTMSRKSLESARRAVLSARLVCVAAPAGFGKSTLVATWVTQWRRENITCAWVNLDPEDSEPSCFLHSLFSSLHQADAALAADPLSLLEANPVAPSSAVLDSLVDRLAEHDDEFVLVLEDYHFVTNPLVDETLAELLRRSPPQFHLVLTTRASLPPALDVLHLNGARMTLETEDLRFSREEVELFLTRNVAKPLVPERLAELRRFTGGWPAAVRAAAMGPLLKPRSPTDVRDLEGTLDLILESALDVLPPQLVQFMALTSILSALDTELCQVVTQDPRSPEFFVEVRTQNLLVHGVGADGQWLQYHPLLKDYLQRVVLERFNVDRRALHTRAAQWYADHGAWTEAVSHGLEGNNTGQAVEWLDECGMDLVKSGDLLTLLDWRRRFPSHLLQGHPSLQLAIAWGLALALRFDEAALLLGEVERQKHDVTATRGKETAGELAVIRATAAALKDDLPAASHWLHSFDDGGRIGDVWARNVASNVQRFLCWKAGRWVEIYQAPWELSSSTDDIRNAFATVYREIILGSVEMDQGRVALAEEHAKTAKRLATT
ncbi:MAG: hypothetical protein ABSF50_23345, partial [Burkholderiaceae bacterium]